jgi:hypothetical protein
MHRDDDWNSFQVFPEFFVFACHVYINSMDNISGFFSFTTWCLNKKKRKTTRGKRRKALIKSFVAADPYAKKSNFKNIIER